MVYGLMREMGKAGMRRGRPGPPSKLDDPNRDCASPESCGNSVPGMRIAWGAASIEPTIKVDGGMKVSVCVASVRAPAVQATIRSIRAQTLDDWELIVVGQGADSGLPAAVAEAAGDDHRIRYLHIEQRGASRARNAAIRAAGADLIALIDDDCEAQADWLATLASCFDREADTGVVGGSIVAPASHHFPSACLHWIPTEALYDPVEHGPRAPSGWCWFGANVAVRRSVLDRIGEFDECLGPGAVFPGANDVDYRLRLEADGVRMRSTPRAVVYHTYGRRSGWNAVWRYFRDIARADAALGAKLTMLGDPRGRSWPWASRRDWVDTRIRTGRPYRLLSDLLCAGHARRAYRECLSDYQLDPQRHVLQRKQASAVRDQAPWASASSAWSK